MKTTIVVHGDAAAARESVVVLGGIGDDERRLSSTDGEATESATIDLRGASDGYEYGKLRDRTALS